MEEDTGRVLPVRQKQRVLFCWTLPRTGKLMGCMWKAEVASLERRLGDSGGPSQPPAAPAALRRPCSDLQGAFAGLTVGLLLGLVRLVLDFVYTQPQCHQPDERPAVVKDVHYLYLSTILSAVTLVTMSAVSWLTEPPSTERVHWGLPLGTLRPFAARDRRDPHWALGALGCRLRPPARTHLFRCFSSGCEGLAASGGLSSGH